MSRLIQLSVLTLFFHIGTLNASWATDDDDIPKNETHWKKEFGKVKITPEQVYMFMYVDLGEIDITQESFQIEIENDKGENLINHSIDSKSFNLMMTDFEPGMYLLKVVTDNYIYTKSFTKN